MEFIGKLPIPKEIKEQYPLDEASAELKAARDRAIRAIFEGKDDRMMLIIGPCSADRADAVLDYIGRLKTVQDKVADKLLLITDSMEATGCPDGEYAIAGQGGSRRQVREAIELATPVEGIITGKFDIRQGNFGVKIAATAADRITAIDNGTVVQSLWTPETGYIVVLQHAGNLISVYKNLSQSLVTTGQTIRSGELIGYNAEVQDGEVRLFEFELWNNGKPVDPEGYIVF